MPGHQRHLAKASGRRDRDQMRFDEGLGTYSISVAPESVWISKGMGTHYFQIQLEVGIPQVMKQHHGFKAYRAASDALTSGFSVWRALVARCYLTTLEFPQVSVTFIVPGPGLSPLQRGRSRC